MQCEGRCHPPVSAEDYAFLMRLASANYPPQCALSPIYITNKETLTAIV